LQKLALKNVVLYGWLHGLTGMASWTDWDGFMDFNVSTCRDIAMWHVSAITQ
jgi:hypothetical protein